MVTIAFWPQLASSGGQNVTFEAKDAGVTGSLLTCTVMDEALGDRQTWGGARLLRPVALTPTASCCVASALSHGDDVSADVV